MDQTEVVLAVPKWPIQPWYNSFQGTLSQEPYVVTPQKRKSTSTTKIRGATPVVAKNNTPDREDDKKVFTAVIMILFRL